MQYGVNIRQVILDPSIRPGCLKVYTVDSTAIAAFLGHERQALSEGRRGSFSQYLDEHLALELNLPDPENDPEATFAFLDRRDVNRLLAIHPNLYRLHEVFATLGDAQAGRGPDGRAFMAEDGDYVVIDPDSGQVVYKGERVHDLLDRLDIRPNF